jgi:hypothetical protein
MGNEVNVGVGFVSLEKVQQKSAVDRRRGNYNKTQRTKRQEKF